MRVYDTEDPAPVLARYHVPPDLQACHTAIVGNYVVEGHVPADLIKRMLREQPRIAGLSAPGMPPASPGMDMENGGPYRIMAFTADGRSTVYAERH